MSRHVIQPTILIAIARAFPRVVLTGQPSQDFDALCDAFGVAEAKALGRKNRHAVLRRWTRHTKILSAARFADEARRCLLQEQSQILLHRAKDVAVQAKAKARRDERQEVDAIARSIHDPVSRLAGLPEHLVVLARLPQAAFHRTPEWRRTRWEALRLAQRRCHQCGRHVADEATLEAVHLVGRHERPDLAFALTNVVVLCDRCRPGRRASGNF
jgi:hypothetical protein